MTPIICQLETISVHKCTILQLVLKQQQRLQQQQQQQVQQP